MGKPKKKRPITRLPTQQQQQFKQSSTETARRIRQFHLLNKRLAQCQSQPTIDRVQEQAILSEMEAMGGLDWYQKASQLGQSKVRGGDSSKWLIQTLREKVDLDSKEKPLRLLEVGAVAPDNYKQHARWINVHPIDLHPQHESIQQQDFLTMKPPQSSSSSQQEACYDIVSLSLVVNFVGDPADRGRMLLHTRRFFSSVIHQHRLHHLFVVLPLPCITNSRYMSHDHFQAMMVSMGYTMIHHHFSNKLAYYLFELTKDASNLTVSALVWKKKILPGLEGGGRNNFCVTINANKK